MNRVFGPDGWLRLTLEFLIGLAQDYWKDPKPVADAPPPPPPPEEELAPPPPSGPVLWHADYVQIRERLWGRGEVLPGGDALAGMLIAPLGLSKEMSVLDLAAGLGNLARTLVDAFAMYVDGMDPDDLTARRGMEMSVAAGKGKHAAITAYDPTTFTIPRKYDCILARELFYRLQDKRRFFKMVAGSLKPRGQIVFTDYILDPEFRDREAIVAWKKCEESASPLSLSEMTQTWAKLGFDVRVNEDQTRFYRQELRRGLARFTNFIAKNQADNVTRLLILQEIELWVRRGAAFEQGLKFCRFHAIKI